MGNLTAPPPLLTWGVSVLPIPGETQSSDLHLVKLSENGALAAAVDGLGHGAAAVTAARMSVAELDRHAAHESVIQPMKRCHHALVKTRGAGMTPASLDGRKNQMTWMGVGSVALHARGTDDALVVVVRYLGGRP